MHVALCVCVLLLLQITKAESVLTVDAESSRALRLINVLNLYIVNERGQVGGPVRAVCNSDRQYCSLAA